MPDDPRDDRRDDRRVGIAHAPDAVERRLQAALDRAWSDRLLAQSDAGKALTRDLAALSDLGLPAPSEIEAALGRLTPAGDDVSSKEGVERLLALDRVGDVVLEGMRLNDLLAQGLGGPAGRQTIEVGLKLLRGKKYQEAGEWWALKRTPLAGTDSQLELLLTLLLVLTYHIAGDQRREQAELARARQLRGGA